MRFACVEYITKSGGIWKHTDERPNYLADPVSEIDHTSFGTWTSALKGEHVPVSWFIDGKAGPAVNGRYSLLRRASMKWNRRRGRQSVTFDNLKYLENFDVVLVCFHSYGHRLMREFITAARRAYPEKTILATHAVLALGVLREQWKEPDWYRDFVEFARAGDLMLVGNPEEVEYLKLAVDTPVEYFTHFYPTLYTDNFRKPRPEKTDVIFVAGDTRRSDIIWSCLLAKEVQRRHPEFLIQVVGSDGYNYEPLEGARFEVLSRMDWDTYLRTTANATLILNTDVFWTNGRVQADAAAVGTPCIGVNAGRQTELFPELACSDIEGTARAIELAERLITDSDFYESVVRNAYERLKLWSYECGPARLERLVERIAGGTMPRA